MAQVTFHVVIHEEDDGSFWSEVTELPGCFASGFSLDELRDATFEAMQLWLPDGIELDDPRWAPVRKRKSTARARKGRPPPREMLVCA